MQNPLNTWAQAVVTQRIHMIPFKNRMKFFMKETQRGTSDEEEDDITNRTLHAYAQAEQPNPPPKLSDLESLSKQLQAALQLNESKYDTPVTRNTSSNRKSIC